MKKRWKCQCGRECEIDGDDRSVIIYDQKGKFSERIFCGQYWETVSRLRDGCPVCAQWKKNDR